MAGPLIENAPASDGCMPPHPRAPGDGDVVITKEAQSDVYYTVRQVPGIVQFRVAALEQAVRLARGVGQQQTIDVWFSERGTVRLLEAYRPCTQRLRAADPAGDGSPRPTDGV